MERNANATVLLLGLSSSNNLQRELPMVPMAFINRSSTVLSPLYWPPILSWLLTAYLSGLRLQARDRYSFISLLRYHVYEALYSDSRMQSRLISFFFYIFFARPMQSQCYLPRLAPMNRHPETRNDGVLFLWLPP
jgi:hypothetical protein